MDSTTKTQQTVDDIIDRYKAAYPIIWVKTEEYARTIEILRGRFLIENESNEKLAKERHPDAKTAEEIPMSLRPRNIFHWDAINGLVNVTNLGDKCERVFPPQVKKEGPPPPEPPAWTHILAWANHLKVKTVPPGSIVLVNGFHNLLAGSNPQDHGRIRAAITQIIQPSLRKVEGETRLGLREGESFRTVIIVGPKPDHPTLTPDIMTYLEVIEFPRPSEDEITAMIELQLGQRKTVKGKGITADKELVDACALELKGTTVFQSENAISLTYVKKRELDRKTLRRQYKAIMEMHPALTLSEYKESWDDLVGFELYKRFVTALFHPQQSQRALKGVLFVGAPGTGKSHAAKATGSHLSLKTIFCNFGRVFNKFIGSSEENTESLFRSIDACGRAVVFVDEIEKALGGMGKGGGGDSGVGDRFMQSTLTWMNDHDSGAFMIATANDPSKLPPELLREGRWDCIFNVPPPNNKQRVSLTKLYAGKANLIIDPESVVERTDMWVGAEIKGLLEKAEVFRLGCKSDEEALETAFSYVRPMIISDRERFLDRIEKSKAQGVSVNIEELATEPDFELPPVTRRRSFED